MKNFEIDTMSDGELMGHVLKNKNLGFSIIKDNQTFFKLREKSSSELLNIEGVGLSNALAIKSLFELCKRIEKGRSKNMTYIKSSKEASVYFRGELSEYDKEVFAMIVLNVKKRIIAREIISIGTIDISIVHPREVFLKAIREKGSSIIVAHNHPSGECEPSEEDISITKRLKLSGDILGINLLDHIIIGDDEYYSFKEKGKI